MPGLVGPDTTLSHPSPPTAKCKEAFPQFKSSFPTQSKVGVNLQRIKLSTVSSVETLLLPTGSDALLEAGI